MFLINSQRGTDGGRSLAPAYFKNLKNDYMNITIKKIGGNIKEEDNYLIFQHAGGNGRVYLDFLTEKILQPYIYDLFYKN